MQIQVNAINESSSQCKYSYLLKEKKKEKKKDRKKLVLFLSLSPRRDIVDAVRGEVEFSAVQSLSRDPLPVFPARSPCEQFWPGQGCPLFGVVHPAFPLPTLQGALKDGFREAVVACDMPEPRKIPSLHSCQKRFLPVAEKASE